MRLLILLGALLSANGQVIHLVQNTASTRLIKEVVVIRSLSISSGKIESKDLTPLGGTHLIIASQDPNMIIVAKYRGAGTIVDLRSGEAIFREYTTKTLDGSAPEACIAESIGKHSGQIGVWLLCGSPSSALEHFFGPIRSSFAEPISVSRQLATSDSEIGAYARNSHGLSGPGNAFYTVGVDRVIIQRFGFPASKTTGIKYPQGESIDQRPNRADDILLYTPKLLAITASGEQIDGPASRLFIYSREEKRWSKFMIKHDGGLYWIKNAGDFVTGGLTGRDSGTALKDTGAPAEKRRADISAALDRFAQSTITRFPKESQAQHFINNRGIPPGKLFVFNGKTGEQWWMEGMEPDSEILTVSDRFAYYRVNDTLWRRELLTGGSFGESEKLLQEDWLYDVHWGVFSGN